MNILLNIRFYVDKLRILGFRQSACTWFTSCLDGRSQKTRVEGCLSGPLQMSSGVPQGSILDPLLFICYISDLPSVASWSSTFLCVDGSAVLVKGKNAESIRIYMNHDLLAVDNWFGFNKLALNKDITKCILFCSNWLT